MELIYSIIIFLSFIVLFGFILLYFVKPFVLTTWNSVNESSRNNRYNRYNQINNQINQIDEDVDNEVYNQIKESNQYLNSRITYREIENIVLPWDDPVDKCSTRYGTIDDIDWESYTLPAHPKIILF